MNDITYDELRLVLEQEQLGLTPAELHGAICGLACAGSTDPLAGLWGLLLEGQAPGEELVLMSASMLEQASRRLQERQMQFQPLLPDDDTPLVERAEELALWCQGCLAGLGATGRLEQASMGEQVGEIVMDFSRLSQAGFDPEDEDLEEAENAFAEIVEYVRVGAQLIYEELAAPEPEADSPRTLH